MEQLLPSSPALSPSSPPAPLLDAELGRLELRLGDACDAAAEIPALSGATAAVIVQLPNEALLARCLGAVLAANEASAASRDTDFTKEQQQQEQQQQQQQKGEEEEEEEEEECLLNDPIPGAVPVPIIRHVVLARRLRLRSHLPHSESPGHCDGCDDDDHMRNGTSETIARFLAVYRLERVLSLAASWDPALPVYVYTPQQPPRSISSSGSASASAAAAAPPQSS